MLYVAHTNLKTLFETPNENCVCVCMCVCVCVVGQVCVLDKFDLESKIS